MHPDDCYQEGINEEQFSKLIIMEKQFLNILNQLNEIIYNDISKNNKFREYRFLIEEKDGNRYIIKCESVKNNFGEGGYGYSKVSEPNKSKICIYIRKEDRDEERMFYALKSMKEKS